GALMPRKGVDVLLRALTLLDPHLNWHLTVIGGGPEADRLKALALSLPSDRVSFSGPATNEEVRVAMIGADLVVAPSIIGKDGRSEGIPVVLIEAMAAARPVISSRLSGIPELVKDGETGFLIEPGDVVKLAEQIMRVAENYSLAVEISQAGRQLVIREFDIEKTAANLLALIEKNS
ncbi:glycosyltransferase family 4 protein, partial [Falsihalocynthiibacter sp. CO-5D18]|uniref:glycosyltransferase family 4 protein n=1 Tax=Falsihalocynthiibacter sp. CO-5D18 TaxID=3240872 RepID=UPI00351020E5